MFVHSATRGWGSASPVSGELSTFMDYD
jgi:hypothetical protein